MLKVQWILVGTHVCRLMYVLYIAFARKWCLRKRDLVVEFGTIMEGDYWSVMGPQVYKYIKVVFNQYKSNDTRVDQKACWLSSEIHWDNQFSPSSFIASAVPTEGRITSRFSSPCSHVRRKRWNCKTPLAPEVSSSDRRRQPKSCV